MPSLLDHRDPAEAERILSVLRPGYAAEAALIGVEDFPPLRRTVTDIAASRNEFAGSCSGAVLAAVIEFGEGQVDGDAALDIASLAVHPQFARRGFGSVLVAWVLERCAGRAATVSTARSNFPAIALYGKLGFVFERSFVAPEGIECVALRRPPSRSANGSGR
jgi:ribosomal protein S18 acetylase RimI-like enzyme